MCCILRTYHSVLARTYYVLGTKYYALRTTTTYHCEGPGTTRKLTSRTLCRYVRRVCVCPAARTNSRLGTCRRSVRARRAGKEKSTRPQRGMHCCMKCLLDRPARRKVLHRPRAQGVGDGLPRSKGHRRFVVCTWVLRSRTQCMVRSTYARIPYAVLHT